MTDDIMLDNILGSKKEKGKYIRTEEVTIKDGLQKVLEDIREWAYEGRIPTMNTQMLLASLVQHYPDEGAREVIDQKLQDHNFYSKRGEFPTTLKANPHYEPYWDKVTEKIALPVAYEDLHDMLVASALIKVGKDSDSPFHYQIAKRKATAQILDIRAYIGTYNFYVLNHEDLIPATKTVKDVVGSSVTPDSPFEYEFWLWRREILAARIHHFKLEFGAKFRVRRTGTPMFLIEEPNPDTYEPHDRKDDHYMLVFPCYKR